MIKIVLDVFSGDSPEDLIKGACDAINIYPELTFIMPGKREYLETELKKYVYDAARIEILDASEVITNNESPTLAIKTKKDSTLVKGMRLLREGKADGLISAGSTGAVLCGGIFIAGRLDGIERPALCAVLPTEKGGNVALMDCGANADCQPAYLGQFAVLASALMKSVYNVEKPKICLLSNGTEEHKGNHLTQESFTLLSSLPINFTGNIEAREVLSGCCDCVICDGFTGNILLKGIEGTVRMVLGAVASSMKNNATWSIDGLQIKQTVSDVKNALDFNSKGGAILLGCSRPIIKIHGASNQRTVLETAGQMISMIENDMLGKIEESI